MAQEMREAAGASQEEQQLANEMADAFIQDVLPENIFSSPKAGAGIGTERSFTGCLYCSVDAAW
jgi:splicing factor 3B subunit 3